MNWKDLLRKFINPKRRLRRYAISEATILEDLSEDIQSLRKVLENHSQSRQKALLKHFEREAERDERKVEYLERRLNRLLSRVKKSLESTSGRFSSEGGTLAKINGDLEVAGNNLIRLVAYRRGEIHQLLKEQDIDWNLVSAKVKEAIGDKKHLGILSLLASLQQLEKLDQRIASRREFSKGATATAALAGAGLLGKSSKALAQSEYLSKTFTIQQQLKAIEYACGQVENLCYGMTRKLSSPILFTPHADYTHFNRVGEWSHKMIQNESSIESVDFGVATSGILADQRSKAIKFQQPTDQAVSFTERSLVTLANLKGRSRVKGKLFAVKHFPGGPPEIEFTEVDRYPIGFDLSEMTSTHLKPFIDVLKLKEANAVMVSHAEYPKIEEELSKKFYQKYEAPVARELRLLGISESTYAQWILNRPASLSPILIRGLLKESLKFEGIVVADALNMGAITAVLEDIFFGAVDPQAIYNNINSGQKDKINLVSLREAISLREILSFILGIYAGLDYFTLAHCGSFRNTEVLVAYASKSPYFQKCLKESITRYQSIFKIIGRTPPVITGLLWQEDHFEQQIKLLCDNEAFPYSASQDPWDRSGALHRFFRTNYFSALYNEDRFTNPQFRAVFWEVNQKTDWKSLDTLFQKVIEERYLP